MQEQKQIIALQAKIQKLQSTNKGLRAENRYYKQRLRELGSSVRHWKAKYKSQKSIIKPSKVKPIGAPIKAKGYQYTTHLIKLSVYLYLVIGCGYRAIVKILLCIELEYGQIGCIPSKSSINIWMQKLGCDKYEQCIWEKDKPYALIIDESMVIGRQRMLVGLAVACDKEQEVSINYQQVKLMLMEVRSSWKAEDIKCFIEKVQEKAGSKPAYVISDGCSTMKRGISDAGMVRICDVSHQIALLIEHYYKDDAHFKDWQKGLAQAKFKGIMQDVAYLLPPKQRTIARFMNLSPCVEWSKKLLQAYDTLKLEEKQFFEWIQQHESFIEQIYQILRVGTELLTLLKIKGLSHKTIQDGLEILNKASYQIPVSLQASMRAYLLSEKDKLPHQDMVWHCCSNCIESVFGKLKQLLPHNAIYGVTGQILALPLLTDDGLNFDINKALEQVSLPVLTKWKQNHVPENQSIKRQKILKK